MKSHNQPINHLNQTKITTRNGCFHTSSLVLSWPYSALQSWMGSRAVHPKTLWGLNQAKEETAGDHKEDLLPLQSSDIWVECWILSGRRNRGLTGTAPGWRENVCNAQGGGRGEELRWWDVQCDWKQNLAYSLGPTMRLLTTYRFYMCTGYLFIQGRYKVWDINLRGLRR